MTLLHTQQGYQEELAEFIGIMIGDGNIFIDSKRSNYQARIFGNKYRDRDYIVNYVAPLISKLFNVNPRIKEGKLNEIILTANNKEFVKKLLDLGLKSGNKLESNIGIPSWIFSDEKSVISCVRGLIDTNGCVFRKFSNKAIPQIEFYSSIDQLKMDFSDAMKMIGFEGKWRNNGKIAGIFERGNHLMCSCVYVLT